MNSNNLTAGVIDGYAISTFKQGACGALAIAIHDATGWPIYAVTDAHNIYGDEAGGGSALHWVVRHPSGLFLDIEGLSTGEALVEEYEGFADEGEAGIGKSTRADAWEWYVECQGAPIPISLAATFVQPTLAVAEQAAEVAHDLDSAGPGI